MWHHRQMSTSCLDFQIFFLRPQVYLFTFAASRSTEFVAGPVDPIVEFMPEISRTHMGGTRRLGLRLTVFQEDSEWSRVLKLYGGVGESVARGSAIAIDMR